MRVYSVQFLTQEEEPVNDDDIKCKDHEETMCNIDHREVMKCCPSFGSFTFTSDSDTQTGVLRDFKDWLGDQTMDDLYSHMSFPKWKEEDGETVQG